MAGQAKDFRPDDFVPDDQKSASASSGDFRPDDFVADKTGDVPSKGLLGTGINVLRGGGKALDYLRGAVGAPLEAGAIKLATGKNPLGMQEYLHGLNPTNLDTVPGGGEMMKRSEVPEGYSLADATKWLPGVGGPLIQKGDPLDITMRGAGGAGMDAAFDPLSWLSFGASSAAKGGMMEKALAMPGVAQATNVATKPSQILSGAGKKLFSWGITPIEQAGERYGKSDVADTMYNLGIKGSSAQIEQKMADHIGRLKDLRDSILGGADAAGATVNRGDAFHEFGNTLNQMVADRRMTQEQADKILQDTIGTYLTGARPSTTLATQWKSDMYKSLPQKVWDTTKVDNLGQSLNKSASGGLKTAIEDTVEGATGRGADLKDANSQLGQLLSVSPATSKWADMLERRPTVTQWDVAAGLGGGLFTHNPAKGATMLAAKKLLEIGRMPYVRTNVGSFLRTAGEGAAAPFLDTLGVQALKNSLKKGPQDGEEISNPTR